MIWWFVVGVVLVIFIATLPIPKPPDYYANGNPRRKW